MIDVVGVAHFLLQVHIIVDGGDDILLGNVLRNQLVDVPVDGLLQELLVISAFFQDTFEHRIEY